MIHLMNTYLYGLLYKKIKIYLVFSSLNEFDKD